MLIKIFFNLKFIVTFMFMAILMNSDAVIPTVLVSVAPHQFFVNKIAENTVDVYLMVPAGASSHTYEPSPRQMIKAGQASLWFSIGETFEKKAVQALQSHHSSFKVINLQQSLNLISHDHGHKGCCPGSVDLHFWLSARQAQIQAQTIAEALSLSYPEHAELYRKNLIKFQKELQNLDREIEIILALLKNRHMLVGHPAYGYFCRDYGLEQYSIEIEGKDPTPRQTTKLLGLARSFEMKTIFIQPQYNNKAAQLIAKEIGAKLVTLDPYAENYMITMLEIARAFAAQ